jgi:hypothetical protein
LVDRPYTNARFDNLVAGVSSLWQADTFVGGISALRGNTAHIDTYHVSQAKSAAWSLKMPGIVPL